MFAGGKRRQLLIRACIEKFGLLTNQSMLTCGWRHIKKKSYVPFLCKGGTSWRSGSFKFSDGILKYWQSFTGSNLCSWIVVCFLFTYLVLSRDVEGGGSFCARKTKLLSYTLKKNSSNLFRKAFSIISKSKDQKPFIATGTSITRTKMFFLITATSQQVSSTLFITSATERALIRWENFRCKYTLCFVRVHKDFLANHLHICITSLCSWCLRTLESYNGCI